MGAFQVGNIWAYRLVVSLCLHKSWSWPRSRHVRVLRKGSLASVKMPTPRYPVMVSAMPMSQITTGITMPLSTFSSAKIDNDEYCSLYRSLVSSPTGLFVDAANVALLREMPDPPVLFPKRSFPQTATSLRSKIPQSRYIHYCFISHCKLVQDLPVRPSPDL